jgi:hypothetical protein
MMQIHKVSWFASLCFFTFLANLQILSAGVNDGLVGWWKLDEGSGTSSSDSSGNDRSLVLQNGVAWTDGVYGGAVDLDGSDDQISLSNLEVDGNFSVSLWAKPLSSTHIGGYESSSENNSVSYLNRTIVKPVHGQGTDFGIGLSVGTNGISSLIHASSIYCQPLIYSASLSSWTHIVLVLENRQPKLYVNGNLARTGLTLSRPVKLQISSGSPIGKGYDHDDRYHGELDDFRIYDRVLSVDEINELYDFPVGLHTVGSINVIENSLIGSIVGEFNATDPNGDTLTYKLMPALPSDFSPVLWLDANDSSTVIRSSGVVSTWEDKSGNNYHFTQNADTSRRPIYSTTSLNGMPSITFDGSNDYLSISSRLGFSVNPEISVFAVTSFISNIATDNRIFQLGNNAHSLAVAGGSGSWSWRFNGGNEVYNAVSLNTPAQQAWVRQAGSNYSASQFFYNGTEKVRVNVASPTTVPSDNAAVSFVGAGASDGSWTQNLSANVKISELIVLNDSSEISRKAIETYLARKWGLTYTQPTSDGIFELDSNGTLKSLVSLDRETVASLPITVRATDSNGNFIEKDFSVTVLDDGLEDTDGDGLSDAQERSGFSQYEQINGAYSWSTAKAEAESRGGHLATIADLAEQTAVESFVSGSVWLGGTDQVDEGNWTWVDGSPWTYANWSSVQAFNATGSDQSFVVPTGVTSLSVKIWGAGGGGGREGYRGGAGGYTEGNLTVTPGETLTIIVGQGGILHSGFPLDRDYRYGGGASGGGGDSYNLTFGSGGGRSAVRRGTLELATAGGGGGGGYADHGGNAGGANGLPVLGTLSSAYPHGGQTNNNGLGPGGTGGTHGQSGNESGVAGIQFKGGYSQGINGALTSEAGGGGGGYFGGGGGGDNRGGGGGSGYFGGLSNGATSGSAQGTLYPPNTTDPDYPSASNPSTGSGAIGTAGDGASTGNSTGGDGLIVLQWSPAHAPTSTNEDYLSIDSSRGGKWVPQPSSQNLGFLLETTYVSDPNLSDSDGDGFADNLEYNAGSNPESNTSSPLEYGLTAWYPFDGNASDMSGNGRHGTTYNGAGWAAGKVGQALSLDGVDDYLDAGDFEIGGAVTFAAWVKYDAFKHWSRVFDFGNGQDNNNILMANDQTSAASRFNLHLPAGNPSLTGTNLTLNAWLHRAGVIEANGNMKLYLNGTLNASNTNTSALPTITRTQQYVGRSNWSNDGYLDGLIDDFRIYNRALSATEVSNLYQLPNSDADGDGYTYGEELIAGTSPYSASSHPNLETGLMAWYPFDGNTSDMSGNDRDATAVNTHSFVSGKIGSGVRILGSDSGVAGHVMLPYISSLENSDTTFAFWVWEEDMLHDHGEAYLAYGQIESVHNYIGGQSFNFGSNTYVSGITRASWNHYAVTKAGSVRKGYLNGTLVAEGSWSAPASYNPTESALGRHWWSGTAASSTRLIAIFDDLRIYDRALTANEITRLQTWTSVTNSPPANLYPQSSLIIAENNPVGSLVGQFSATDADGDNVSYLLVRGAGDTANSYFNLESNGTLKTAVIFDYENNASSFSIRVQAKDEHLGATEGNFTIFLHDLDDTAPVITLTGATSVTHEAGSRYLDANASWTDAVDGIGVVYASGVVDAGVPGTYQLTFNYTDVAGNVAQEIIRTVEVVDTTAPVINLVGGVVVTHPVGSVYSDSGASWNDAVDGAGTISSIGSVNYMSPGTYTLSYDYTDQAGNAAQSIVRTVNVVNSPPNGLAVINDQNLTLFENEPNGTLLGQFVGADPNSNTQFGYELISVFDANDSSLLLENAFQVASNGTLRSLRSFDYEVDPRKYILDVRVNDQFGGSFSRSFTAYVRNMVEDLDGDGVEDHFDIDDDGDGFEDSVEVAYGHDPDDNQSMPRLALIETIAPSFDGNRSYTLSGRILSSGGMPLISYGIVILEQNGTESYYEAETIEADLNATFHVLFANLKAGKTYQYSSFVRNFVGESRGQVLRVEVEEKIDPFAWWVDSRELDGGWRESDWLGTFLRNSENGWVYHLDLAWVFTRSDGTGGMWMWRNEEESWLWAEPNTWPFLWSDLTKDWLYFIFLEGKIKIFDYSQGSFR